MASNIYTQHYVDGSSRSRRRREKQGRKPIPEELKMIRTNITTSRIAKKIIKQKAQAMGLSFSAYLELSGILYTPELLNT
jgi:predicted metalloendopeptidase